MWVSATKQASHTHKLFTLRRKKGTEKPVPIFYAHAKAEEGHRHREACFVADTHSVESLWVWEACFVADTQIMKNGRYNKKIIYSRMPAAGVRGVYGDPTLRAMHSIHKCVAKGTPHLLAVLRNEPRYS